MMLRRSLVASCSRSSVSQQPWWLPTTVRVPGFAPTTTTAVRLFSKQEDSNNNSTTNNSQRFASQFKNPIVHQLWTARGQAKAKAKAANGNGNGDREKPRVPSQSMTEISYPFSTDEFLKETYKNPWSQMR